MKINVHIERLILEGLPPTIRQGVQVRRPLEMELARLLARGGLSEEIRGSIALPQVQAGTLQFSSDERPAKLGQGIARAVHEGIGQQAKRAEPARSNRVPGGAQ
jgi:hypothetical protein